MKTSYKDVDEWRVTWTSEQVFRTSAISEGCLTNVTLGLFTKWCKTNITNVEFDMVLQKNTASFRINRLGYPFELQHLYFYKASHQASVSGIAVCPQSLILTHTFSPFPSLLFPVSLLSWQERKSIAHWCAKRARVAFRTHPNPVQHWWALFLLLSAIILLHCNLNLCLKSHSHTDIL